MCGITGIINLKGLDPEPDRRTLANMNQALSARGPDDDGFYLDHHAGLGHRRLSIIDLEGGHQPITTPDGRFTIVYNGETYNYQTIRAGLKKNGAVFNTNSDTETILKLFAEKGPEGLNEMNGLFSFAIWDKQTQTLFAARDRTGKKPFYYTLVGNYFIFASELKAILKNPLVQKRMEPESVLSFLTYEYVPAPLSIIKGVHKLKQGHFLTFSKNGIRIQRYWNQSFKDKIYVDEKTACAEIISRLERAVQLRLVADVPVGVFLSGGIDSSAIVALLAKNKPAKDIKTFSINFKEASYDESSYSGLIAKKFGTDHHEETLTADLMLDILPEVSQYMDEPFADASILPTYLLSRFTSKHVKVALGGDGGDELFAGYPTFFADRLATVYAKFPGLIKNSVAGLVNLLPVSDKNLSLDFKARQFLLGADYEAVIRNQVWLAGVTPKDQPGIFAVDFFSQIKNIDPFGLIKKELLLCDSPLDSDRLLYFYQKFYMCDDILTKVDRASMANSLEVRAPFLDPDVIAYANALPYFFKLKGRTTKYILKKALRNLLPKEIIYRPKKGFGIPVSGWLRQQLKPLTEKTLSRERLSADGIFNPGAVHTLMQQHFSGKKNNRKQLFSLLVFHLWMDNYLR
ncbi:MAG: asparagine synthase (glutamine-hydrolyzing) [Deltaproteobacteria bacterium]|nr:asparagine synthase (glutamine-hydrolyzing) [Deltaproteobacteria bacterium]